MKKYKSKIGLSIVLVLVIILGGSSFIMIRDNVWPGLIINIAVAGFAIYLFISTYYVINGNDLIIKCGFFINMTIKIDRIKKIKETHNLLSSPAASLDRLAIYYGKSGFVMISPNEKMEFINQLLEHNSKIEVILKNGKSIQDTKTEQIL